MEIGEEKNKIENEAKKLNIDSRIFFLGIRNDVNDLMQVMDVLLLPSYYEGNPVAAIEAQACGLPVLTSTAVTLEAKVSSILEQISLNGGEGLL